MTQAKDTLAKFMGIHIAGLAALAVIVAAAWLLGVKPIGQIEARRGVHQAELDELRQSIAKRAALLGQYNTAIAEFQQELASSKVTLKSHTHRNAYLASLTQLAKSTGLRIDSVQPQTMVIAARFNLVPIEIAASGSHPAVLRFLSAIKHQMPDTGVLALQATANDQNDTTDCALRVSLIWFTQPSASIGLPIAEAHER
jgi:Tfp pilus assembly protein PilO